MTTLYLETSAVLDWLLEAPNRVNIISLYEDSENIVSSNLTLVESKRALIRLEKEGGVKPSQRMRLVGILESAAASWTLMDISSAVRTRAVETFPVEPVRSLDAIHLATALEFLKVYPDLRVLSFDKRIVDNLEPLGLEVCKLEP